MDVRLSGYHVRLYTCEIYKKKKKKKKKLVDIAVSDPKNPEKEPEKRL